MFYGLLCASHRPYSICICRWYCVPSYVLCQCAKSCASKFTFRYGQNVLTVIWFTCWPMAIRPIASNMVLFTHSPRVFRSLALTMRSTSFLLLYYCGHGPRANTCWPPPRNDASYGLLNIRITSSFSSLTHSLYMRCFANATHSIISHQFAVWHGLCTCCLQSY